MPPQPRIVLASASPRRAELLRAAGFDPLVRPSAATELRRSDESVERLVMRLAEDKARDVATAWNAEFGAPAVVLGADTEVALDGEPLGKPHDDAHAEALLRRLSGREHRVLTGVFLLRTDDGRSSGGVEATRVRFRPLDAAEIRAYVASGEASDKAGAYGIQGAAAAFVVAIEGLRSNVVGLPVERIASWLALLDVAPPAGAPELQEPDANSS